MSTLKLRLQLNALFCFHLHGERKDNKVLTCITVQLYENLTVYN